MNSQKLKNLFEDPNTDWKYILIVLVLSFLVGGGILGYQYSIHGSDPCNSDDKKHFYFWKTRLWENNFDNGNN